MRISDWSSDVCSSDLRRTDRLADTIFGRVDLWPHGANGRRRGLAALHVELVHLVGDVLHLIDDTTNLRTDAVDRELESEAERVVGDRFQVGDDIRHVDERKGVGEEFDAAAHRHNMRELDDGLNNTPLRETRPTGTNEQ